MITKRGVSEVEGVNPVALESNHISREAGLGSASLEREYHC